MIFLVAYIFILIFAALFIFHAFGSKGNSTTSLPRGCGLDFFFPSTHNTNITSFNSSSEISKHNIISPVISSKLTPAQTDMLSFLQSTCCAIPVQANSVKVLTHPTQFFSELKQRVQAAQHYIIMSALYIGDGPLSREFVECLEKKVKEAAAAGQGLEITILLDYNRMHDRRNLFTIRHLLALAHSTASAAALDDISALIKVQVSLFQTSCCWNQIFEPFGRAKEVLGVQHTKIFCFDGIDTILTGANLSDDYFATRMDRYVVIEDNKYVAEWFTDIVHTLCRLSHRVACRNEFINKKNNGINNNKNNNKRKCTLHKKSDLVILPNTSGLDPSRDSTLFSIKAKELLNAFAARAAAASQTLLMKEENYNKQQYDTFLFPTLQCARANVFHDSLVVQRLLHMAPPSTHIYLTSPYLNMYAQFVDELLSSKSSYDFITASVNTNGWRGAKGFAGYIPFFYLQLERAFFYLMKEYKCSERVKIREFSVDGLTFHAKGLWFVEENEKEKENINNHNNNNNNNNIEKEYENVLAPYLVAYGSTNYGYRSVHKDVEAEVFLFTTNNKLREALRGELIFLLQQSKPVTEERFVRGAEGRFQPVVSLIAQMGQNFL